MKKTLALGVLFVGLVIGFSIAPIAAWAQSVVSALYPSAITFISSSPSGGNGFACRKAGCRVDLGPGATDYIASDGTGVLFGGRATIPTGSYLANPGLLNNANSIFTCAAAWEGFLMRQSGTGGTGTLARTRTCVCTSDGAASPSYAWQNLTTGTLGNATTCNP